MANFTFITQEFGSDGNQVRPRRVRTNNPQATETPAPVVEPVSVPVSVPEAAPVAAPPPTPAEALVPATPTVPLQQDEQPTSQCCYS